MQILIAPNAFKNSLDATAVANAIQLGLKNSKLQCTTTCFPVADGGDGTGELIIKHHSGIKVSTKVFDPVGRELVATFGLIERGKTAVVEMADASGIRLLTRYELNPLRATSVGTGQLIKAALDKGVQRIIIGMGGSATVDGGAGILKALGIRFLDQYGRELEASPESLIHLHSIDTENLHPRIPACEIVVLCDVNNLLLGPLGAAAVFGPQKGANEEDVKKLERVLTQFSKVAIETSGKDISTIKHGGTAGGAAAGLYAFANAKLVTGSSYFLELTGFQKALENCKVVITGEGSLDDQTLQGKAPYAVAKAAKNAGLPVIGLSGKVPLSNSNEMNKYFDVILPIGNGAESLEDALKNTERNLIRTARALGDLIALDLT